MAMTSTPTRRSSSTVDNTIISPPSISRRASSVISLSSSSIGRPTAAAAPTSPSLVLTSTANHHHHENKKRKNRRLLKEYYTLADGATITNKNSNSRIHTSTSTAREGDSLDIDSPQSFNPDLYFHQISSNASLPELLKRENELLNEIRELDGERQSLVYNHHHELIEASDTIRKMKSRAEALDASLDSLKASFESISQLSTALTPSSSATMNESSSSSENHPRSNRSNSHQQEQLNNHPRTLSILSEEPSSPTKSTLSHPPPTTTTTTIPTTTTTTTTSSTETSRTKSEFDPLIHLPALLSLPILLQSLLVHDRSRADSLWGLWEPALRSWEDENVQGVKEIGIECRDVLRRGRSTSLNAY